jgi:23S rRNA-/tRNA-specific pseudouridylate synthase
MTKIEIFQKFNSNFSKFQICRLTKLTKKKFKRIIHLSVLYTFSHRHEVPVTSQPITIVFMDDDIVVVNKPASIPVSGF